jgi:hypothetical protein
MACALSKMIGQAKTKLPQQNSETAAFYED